MGRRSRAFVEQVRARLWARAVHQRKPERSWDSLDDEIIWKGGHSIHRRRIFHRIYRDGSNPVRMRIATLKLNLVELVEQTDGYEGTAAIYHSRLWELLTPPALSIPQIHELSARVLTDLGLYQMNNVEARTGRFLYPRHPAFRAGTLKSIEAGARLLKVAGGLDELCALCLQLRLAVDKLAFAEAAVYLAAAQYVASSCRGRFKLEDDLMGDFYVLVEKRGFRNDWTDIHPLAMSSPPKSAAIDSLIDSLPGRPNSKRTKRSDLRRGLYDWEAMRIIQRSDRRHALVIPPQPIRPLVRRTELIESFVTDFEQRWREVAQMRIARKYGALHEPAVLKRMLSMFVDLPFTGDPDDRPRQIEIDQ